LNAEFSFTMQRGLSFVNVHYKVNEHICGPAGGANADGDIAALRLVLGPAPALGDASPADPKCRKA
jgi:hypothetical protein